MSKAKGTLLVTTLWRLQTTPVQFLNIKEQKTNSQ